MIRYTKSSEFSFRLEIKYKENNETKTLNLSDVFISSLLVAHRTNHNYKINSSYIINDDNTITVNCLSDYSDKLGVYVVVIKYKKFGVDYVNAFDEFELVKETTITNDILYTTIIQEDDIKIITDLNNEITNRISNDISLSTDILQRISNEIAIENKIGNTQQLTTLNNTIVDAINEVNSVAKGANKAIIKSNYSSLITYLLSDNNLNIGQNIYLEQINIPDLWISSNTSTYTNYTYTSDDIFITYIKSGGVIGIYKINLLETQKVDLSAYITNDILSTSLSSEIAQRTSIDTTLSSGLSQRISIDNSISTILSSGVFNNITIGRGGSNKSSNVAIGLNPLYYNTSGVFNSGFGYMTLFKNTSGSHNTGVGINALYNNLNGNGNVAIGSSALYNNEAGSNNVAIGNSVAFNNKANSNVIIGYNAGNGFTGDNNVMIGANAGYRTSSNTVVTSSIKSIFIGCDAKSRDTYSTNEIVIGTNALGYGSNTTVIGNSQTINTYIYGVTDLNLSETTLSNIASSLVNVNATTLDGYNLNSLKDYILSGVSGGSTNGNITINSAYVYDAMGYGNMVILPTKLFFNDTFGNSFNADTSGVTFGYGDNYTKISCNDDFGNSLKITNSYNNYTSGLILKSSYISMTDTNNNEYFYINDNGIYHSNNLNVYNINSETSYCSHLYTSDLDINGNLYYYNVAEYTDNSAAIAAGLNIGTVYRTGDLLKIVH